MTEKRPTRRRWFRFSPRTMLVLVTLVCVYLGWAMNWKRQRREFLSRPDVIDYNEYMHGPNVAHQGQSAPLLLRILPEQGIAMIVLGDGTEEVSAYTYQKARSLFPESSISVYHTSIPYQMEVVFTPD
jgi:hypothetical protein